MAVLAEEKKTRNKFIDETNNRYGRLVVIRRTNNNKFNHVSWLCRCDCGVEKAISGISLRSGRVKSCSCLAKETAGQIRKLPYGEASFNQIVRTVKRGAKERNYQFRLTKKQVRGIVTKNCHYCGKSPSQVSRSRDANGVFVYNGIDRVNNTKGYVEGNVVPCCKICNIAKSTMSVEEFKNWILQVHEYFIEDKT